MLIGKTATCECYTSVCISSLPLTLVGKETLYSGRLSSHTRNYRGMGGLRNLRLFPLKHRLLEGSGAFLSPALGLSARLGILVGRFDQVYCGCW